MGKSTLINAVLGKAVAKTGYGITGTTDVLEIYESEKVPFRVIDAIGFEPTFFKEQKAINAVKKKRLLKLYSKISYSAHDTKIFHTIGSVLEV